MYGLPINIFYNFSDFESIRYSLKKLYLVVSTNGITDIFIACEQALVVGGTSKAVGKLSEPVRISFLVPGLSQAYLARRLISRDFASAATHDSPFPKQNGDASMYNRLQVFGNKNMSRP